MTDLAPERRQPIFNIPPVTLALILANVAVQLLRSLLPDDLDDALMLTFGFVPARYLGGIVLEHATWPAWVEPITYQFLHGGWTHLGINMLSLLAFGAGVEQRLGALRFLLFYLGCGVVAAGTELAVEGHSIDLLVGASGAISGLFGAILRFRVHPQRMWAVAAIWLVLNVASGQGAIIGPGGGGAIAWIAHIGGFVAGLLAFPLLDRRVQPNLE